MTPPPVDDTATTGLRAQARERLREAAAAGTGTVIGAPALGALMRLALSPAHAADALALQQELRLHQIEIDVLHEELEAQRQAGRRAGTPAPE